MRPSILFACIAAALTSLATTVVAQTTTVIATNGSAAPPPPGKAAQITPYLGYMVFGDYLKGPLGTSLSNATAPVYGAQIGLRLSPNIALIGNLGYTNSDIRIGLPIFGGFSVSSSSMLIYDGGLELDAPKGSSAITPFVQAGAGAIHYAVTGPLSAAATNFAGNLGVGGDVALWNGLGLRVLAKDYVTKFNIDEPALGVRAQTANNWSFSAGLRLDF